MKKRTIRLRSEAPEDYRAVEELTREAFWNHYRPGCDEHYLAHVLREAEAFIRELDVVAEADGKIVGNIMYTRAQVLGDDGQSHPVLTFGPLSVLPAFQGLGIGTMLIEHTKRLARALGHGAILIYGDPAYYARTGFAPAKTYGIGTREDMYAAALLALELEEGALANCPGRFLEDDAYAVDEEKARSFDQSFPPKPLQTGFASQDRFLELAGMYSPRK